MKNTLQKKFCKVFFVEKVPVLFLYKNSPSEIFTGRGEWDYFTFLTLYMPGTGVPCPL